MNTTVLRIFTTVIKNRQMSRQCLGRVLAARAVEQNQIAAVQVMPEAAETVVEAAESSLA